jgi:nucleoside-diphosphate-sugar epimerase
MKVCVLGSNGFIGKNLLTCDPTWVGVPREKLDLTIQKDVEIFFKNNTFDVVIHCAVVGGSRLEKDNGDVCYKNLLMFENVARCRYCFKKLLYFSSGASRRGSLPTDPYGFSKWLIDKRIESLPNVYSLCIWGCYGPGELPTRFSAVCKREGHVIIPQDCYFDFIDVEDVKSIVLDYCKYGGNQYRNLTYQGPKKKLSEWATFFGATFTIEKEGLGPAYVSI